MARPLPCLMLCIAACGPRSDGNNARAATAPATVPVTTASAEARQHYTTGLDLFDKLRVADARGHFALAAARDPDFALAQYYLALSATTTKEFFERLNRAVALASHASEGERLIILALQAGANADPEKQVGYYEQLVAGYPNDPRGHFLLGFARSGQQAYDQAIAEFTRATALDSNFSPAYNGLGYAYRPLGRYDDAERAFKRYIALIPSEPNPYDSYAELLLKTGRHARSIEMYQKALTLDPHFNSSRAGIAANLMYQEKYPAARAEAQKLVKSARDDGERRAAFLTVAIVELDAGHADRALQQLGSRYAVAKRGKDVAAMVQDATLIGDVELEARQPVQAARQYQQALQMTQASKLSDELKGDARIEQHAHLARVALKRGDLKAAKRETQAYVDSASHGTHPDRVREGHELAGLVALTSRDFAGAQTHLAQANQQDPYVLFAMARAYEGTGDKAKARDMYARVAGFNELPTLRSAAVRRAARAKGS
jgi:tetratricopeptide (TPR) repeat protein